MVICGERGVVAMKDQRLVAVFEQEPRIVRLGLHRAAGTPDDVDAHRLDLDGLGRWAGRRGEGALAGAGGNGGKDEEDEQASHGLLETPGPVQSSRSTRR